MMNKIKPTDFAISLSNYFFEYLPEQKGLSENTINSYKDTISVFLEYCETEHCLKREKIEIKDINRSIVEHFLIWLECAKHNSVSTRNQRKIALSTIFKFLQYENPQYVLLCQQIMSIPSKKCDKQTIKHLTIDAIECILKQPNISTRAGRRDVALLSLMYESAGRVSEIADLKVGSLYFEKKDSIVCLRGKGKKFRNVPLMHDVTKMLKFYISDERNYRLCEKTEPLFCNRSRGCLTRAGISYVFNKYVDLAKIEMPGLLPQKVYPHIFRHSRAMHWLEAGVDLQYIKDLLGHAELSTTEIYAQISTEMKRKILEKVHPIDSVSIPKNSWNTDKNLMNWLKSL